MARDFRGIPFSSIPEPTEKDFTFRLRNMLSEVDAWARDQSAAMARLLAGQVPNGSGAPLPGGGVTETDLDDFFFLPGRSGGQNARGDTDSGGILTFSSTDHATKGTIFFGADSAYDEANVRLGLNTVTPEAGLHIQAAISGGGATLTPSSTISGAWAGPYQTAAGTPLAVAHYVALSSDDGLDSYCGLESTGANGTNPEILGMSGSILDGATYTVTVSVFSLFGNLSGATLDVVIGSSTGANYNFFNNALGSLTGASPTTVTFDVTLSSPSGSTTANSVALGFGGSTSAGVYWMMSYISLSGGSQDIARWDLTTGVESGGIDFNGRLGIGTGSASPGAMTDVLCDSASTVGELITSATSQTANLLSIVSTVAGNATFAVDNKAHLQASIKSNGFLVDSTDLTKKLSFVLTGLTTATTYTWTVGDYSGIPAVPTNEGSSGQILTSAGAGNQPTWSTASSSLVFRKNSGSDVGTRPRLNLIEGTNVTLTVTDDAGDNEVDVTIAAAAAGGTIVVRENSGADVGTRPRLNFIEGTNVTLTVTDDAGDDEVDITIAAAGGSGLTLGQTLALVNGWALT